MGHSLKFHGIATAGLLFWAVSGVVKADDADVLSIYQDYLEQYLPLRAAVEKASFEARKSGSDAAFEQKKAARLALVKLHSNLETFAELVDIRTSGTLEDPIVARLSRILHDQFLFCVKDREAVEKIIELETYLERTLRNHRITVDGKEMSAGEVRQLLRTTTDSSRAEKAWKAYMALGKELDPKVRELMQYRNRFAEKMDQAHYFRLLLWLNKFGSTQFYRFFNFVNMDMTDCFANIKAEIDQALAKKFGIGISQLRPWHYGDLFFRDAPVTPESDLDVLFQNADLVQMARTYFDGLGLPCDDIIKRSEFGTKPTGNLSPCRLGYDADDKVRLACDLEPTVAGAETLFQNMAKALYRENMGDDVPLLLRQPPHGAVDEGLASLFGEVVRNRDFLTEIAHVTPGRMDAITPIAERNRLWRTAVRAQWAQLVVRFEVSFAADPTRDLPHVWSEFAQKYQLLTPPDEEDYRYGYALVPEILFTPAQHYATLMGDILAEQIYDMLTRETMDKAPTERISFLGNEKAGHLIRDKFMKPGNLYHWEKLIRENVGDSFNSQKYLKTYCGVESPHDYRPKPLPQPPIKTK